MRADYLMGWTGLAALVASQHPQPVRTQMATPRQQVDQAARAALDIDPHKVEQELPDGVWQQGKEFWACCRVCERDYELPCDPEDFTEEYNVCAGSWRCLP